MPALFLTIASSQQKSVFWWDMGENTVITSWAAFWGGWAGGA